MTQGYIIKKSVATDEDMKKIAEFTRREMEPSELYTFSVALCNNDVDRDYEKFSLESLEKLAELFVGKTGIFDHSMKTSDQKARIYDAYVEKVDGKKTADGEDFYNLKAKAYMLNNEENKALINDIEAGIKKEVSVSLSASKSICSICNADTKNHRCEHIAGKTYGDKLCFRILDNPTDAYEFSFVAVPAQREAGVTKSFSSFENFSGEDVVKMIEKKDEITLTKSRSEKLFDYIANLKDEASLGQEYKKKLTKEVVDLFKSAFPKMDTSLFASVASVMTTKELLGFRDGMRKSVDKSKHKPQLAQKSDAKTTNYSQFQI